MTRLELVKEVARFLGTEEPDNITTTVSPTDKYQKDIVAAVDTAYEQIQTLHDDWLWRREKGTLSITTSTRTYDYEDIDGDCIGVMCFADGYIYNKYWLIGDNEVGYVPWADWRGNLDRGTRQSTRPEFFTIQPGEVIEFDPTPDQAYTVELDWLKDLDVLQRNTDVPELPKRFHKVISYRASMYLSEHDENLTRFGMAKERYFALLHKLRKNQRPNIDLRIVEPSYGGGH